ncbi:MAG: DNA polymerase I [Gammaproteobacteria bacterium]|nr:MAG: DNA polymerase I [Gammaproteobacteria bacterium]
MAKPYPLVLVDASSYLFRAYHALPKLTNSKGEATGALVGVINMLRKLREDYQPELMAVVFDAPGKTFRDDLFAEYKSHRPPMPDDLREQIEPLHAVVRALGLPLLAVPEVEADDVIGTLAARAAAQGMATLISTGDKDLAQLVDEHVTLVNTMSDERLDREGVIAKFGVPPERIVDYLTLVGDSVDNIPGVAGCGPKTAVKWLQEYGDLAGVIANAPQIKGKVGENLRQSLDQLPLSRQLTSIRLDVALDLELADLKPTSPDLETLRAWYRRIESRRLLESLEAEARRAGGTDRETEVSTRTNTRASSAAEARPSLAIANAETVASGRALPGPTSPETAAVGKAGDSAASQDTNNPPHLARTDATAHPHPVPQHPAYEIILDPPLLDAWLARLAAADLFVLDTETTSLDYIQARIVGLSFAIEAGAAAYVPLAHSYLGAPAQLDREAVLARLQPLLEDPARLKAGHNLKYDMSVLANHGIELRGIAQDTMLESYVLDSTASRHDMDSLALKYLGHRTIHFEDIAGKGAGQLTFDQIPLEQAGPYAAEDAEVTLRLHRAFAPRLDQLPGLARLYREIEIPLVPVLSRLERQGVRIDRERLADQSRDLTERLARLEEAAHCVAGRPFNLGSPKQIGEIFFAEQGLPVLEKTPKGAPSTAESVLQQLADAGHELPRLILEHRGLAKLKSTYTDKLPQMVSPLTGRVHTSYHQAVAATGRLSSSDPNLQNIPIRGEDGRRIRLAFIADPGCKLVAADYSQIELRIMAHLSGDERLLAAFAAGQDIHTATAAEVWGLALDQVSPEQRRSAKAINFGLIYGMSAFGLAKQLGVERGEAQAYVDLYFQRYTGVKDFMERTRQQARRDKYVETIFGRRLHLPDIDHPNQARRSGAERTAINAPMQGSAADIIKRAMIAVDAWIQAERPPVRMIMQVHDELVFEVEEGAVAQVKPRIRAAMESAAELAVPLLVEIGVGDNWEEAH